MAGWGDGGSAFSLGGGGGGGDVPRLKERKDEDIPDAWDDSDSDDDDASSSAADDATTETESATVKGSTNSLAGMADGAWGEESDGEETAGTGKSGGSPA